MEETIWDTNKGGKAGRLARGSPALHTVSGMTGGWINRVLECQVVLGRHKRQRCALQGHTSRRKRDLDQERAESDSFQTKACQGIASSRSATSSPIPAGAGSSTLFLSRSPVSGTRSSCCLPVFHKHYISCLCKRNGKRPIAISEHSRSLRHSFTLPCSTSYPGIH